MGLKAVNLDKKVKNRRARQNCFYKRKIGILRKVIQISKLCEKNVLLYIYDDELSHLYEYKNNEEFDLNTIQTLLSRTPEQNQNNAKFPFSKFTSYGDKDYELLTKRHLPQNQWEKGMNELKDIVEELSCKSTNNENLELQIDSCTGQKEDAPTPKSDVDVMMSHT